MGIADRTACSDVKTRTSARLSNRSSMIARHAGYSVLHAKAEEFDLGGSPHCWIPIFCRLSEPPTA